MEDGPMKMYFLLKMGDIPLLYEFTRGYLECKYLLERRIPIELVYASSWSLLFFHHHGHSNPSEKCYLKLEINSRLEDDSL